MSEVEVTFEEYLNAKKFARWKYKYGLFVLIGCWIALILLIIYIVIYAKELSTNPAVYMLEELGAKDCNCYGEGVRYYINTTATEVFYDLMDSPIKIP